MPESTNKLAKLLDERLSKSEGVDELERLVALRQQAIEQDALT